MPFPRLFRKEEVKSNVPFISSPLKSNLLKPVPAMEILSLQVQLIIAISRARQDPCPIATICSL